MIFSQNGRDGKIDFFERMRDDGGNKQTRRRKCLDGGCWLHLFWGLWSKE